MAEEMLDPATTALVLIDLQNGIVGRDTAPHPARTVVENAVRLAERFRELGGFVVLVRVSFSADGKDVLTPANDAGPMAGARTEGWDQITAGLGPREGDHVVTKRNWGAFYGTDLDLQLRRRGIRTIVLGGIATNYGVESTARDAFERAYEQVIVEDATTSFGAEAHSLAFEYVFPRLARIRSTAQVLAALGPRG